MFRVVTFNLWHGLNPGGHLQFDELEPEFRRNKRLELQEELLFSSVGRKRQPLFDVAFLQEVNPLGARVGRWLEGSPLRVTSQLDSAGLKIFGFGPPFNLQSGLVTLSGNHWLGQSLKPLRLSGRAQIRGFTAIQWTESRWAAFQEILHPKWGRVLLVNVHLHHGLQWDHELEALLGHWSIPSLRQILRRGTERRLAELKLLLDHLQQVESAYALILMGGDFNATPETEEMALIRGHGFIDSWERWGGGRNGPKGLTFDSGKNSANHRLLGHFEPSWAREIEGFKSLSKKDKDKLTAELLRLEYRPRRIDYIFVKALADDLKISQAKVDLLGHRPQQGVLASDHFGLQLELEL